MSSSSSSSSSASAGRRNKVDSIVDEQLELKQVFIVMRHGARTPISVFPTDPNKVEDWPSPPGKLTNQGLTQHYFLGEHFRRRYINDANFLKSCYDQREIYVRSTDYDRTIRSAMANMAGMFPACPNGTNWSRALNWVPVTVHSEATSKDRLMTYWNTCPRLSRCIDEIFEREIAMIQFERKNEKLLNFIKQESGWKADFRSMWKIGDCLKSERENNLTWASWANETIYNLLIDVEILNFQAYSFNDTLKKFTAGNMLKEIESNMNKLVKGETVEKMRVYSGHDTTIISLMAVLNLWKMKKVNYASYLAFELYLHKKEGNYYIKIFLRDDGNLEDPQPHLQPLSFCDKKTLCPLQRFQQFVTKYYITDWNAECAVEETEGHRIAKLEQTVTALTVTLTLMTIALLGIAGFAGLQILRWRQKLRTDLNPTSSHIVLQS